jgi:hypothetical protein
VAYTTRLEAGLPGIQWMKDGLPLILKRCCMTMPS